MKPILTITFTTIRKLTRGESEGRLANPTYLDVHQNMIYTMVEQSWQRREDCLNRNEIIRRMRIKSQSLTNGWKKKRLGVQRGRRGQKKRKKLGSTHTSIFRFDQCLTYHAHNEHL
mmetsp:Transcript_31955/g.67653  ORF Transcript_31955/g.67653 Transcript_31955/m.67653 type:complete len:116 (-) Transcript_31955:38-385(-)